MAKLCPKGFKEEDVRNDTPIFHLTYTQTLLSGRWKSIIIDFLTQGPKRFNEIQKHLDGLSQGSLTKQLKEMEQDELIIRTVYPEVPPRVEYELTDKGLELMPILSMMVDYGEKYTREIVKTVQ